MNLYYTTDQANSISWMDGDVYYMLMDIKKSVSKDELTAMAKQMIDMDTTSANKGTSSCHQKDAAAPNWIGTAASAVFISDITSVCSTPVSLLQNS